MICSHTDMADYIVVEILEAIVWCLEQTVFTIFGVVEGIIMLLAYIPTFIENSLALVELLILGMFNSVKFVISFFFYVVSFMINLPENLADMLTLFESGVGEGLRWTVSGISYVFTSIAWFLLQIILLSRELVIFTLSYTGNLLHFIFFSTVNVFHAAMSYLISSTQSLLFILTDKVRELIFLPVLLSQNLIEMLLNTGKTICLNVSNAMSVLSELPKEAFNKLLSGFEYYISLAYPVKGDQERVNLPHSGVDWLARFSQLMLVFSFIIFVLVTSVLLYHMRNKIIASLAAALNVLLSKLSLLISRGEDNGGNNENQQRPQILQVQREIEEGSDENVDGGVESSDDDSGIAGTQMENRGTVLRGGSRERELQPSASSTSPRNYQRLLQQERDKQLCVVCQDNEKNTLLFPCKHLCVCSECVEQITSAVNLDRRRCPICRGKINSYMDVFT